MTGNPDTERFQSGADKYSAYLQTREGKLRHDLAFANLREFLPNRPERLLALDIGGGPGGMAISLAQLGVHVTLLDASIQMLDLAKRAAQESGVADDIDLKQGDAAAVESLFPASSFDVVLCHNVLEYLEEPRATLRFGSRSLRDSSSVISVLVRNQAGEVLKSAILHGDLDAAERNLTSEWGNESLYGGRVRLFTPERLRPMLTTASLAVIAERGVRVVSDYLPLTVSGKQRIFQLERKLGQRPDFASLARYTQCIAHRVSPTPTVVS